MDGIIWDCPPADMETRHDMYVIASLVAGVLFNVANGWCLQSEVSNKSQFQGTGTLKLE